MQSSVVAPDKLEGLNDDDDEDEHEAGGGGGAGAGETDGEWVWIPLAREVLEEILIELDMDEGTFPRELLSRLLFLPGVRLGGD